MSRITTGELAYHVDERVVLAGWVHHQRHLARVSFLLLRDRDGIAQVVVDGVEERSTTQALVAESVVRVSGIVRRSDQAPGGLEIHESEIEVLSEPASPPPFELRRAEIPAQLPTLLDHAALALRHPRRRAIAQVAAASVHGFRSTLDRLGFTEVHTPKVVASATEGGANVFPVDWFGRPAFLAQSPQFYKQTMVGVFERVYEVGPVFRAEPHDTVRHLAEYVSLDAELGFIDDHRDVMVVVREVLAGMVAAIAERATRAVEVLGLDLPAVPATIPTIGFDDAQAMIAEDTGEDLAGEPDLAPAHERWLGDWARRTHGSDLLFVEGFPMVKRPFYTHPMPGRPDRANGFDLLFRGVELITGGQRLHQYDDYVVALGDVDLTPYGGYLDAFRHGMPPHGGFAIGLERWVSRVVGAANVREVSLFPRDRQRLTP